MPKLAYKGQKKAVRPHKWGLLGHKWGLLGHKWGLVAHKWGLVELPPGEWDRALENAVAKAVADTETATPPPPEGPLRALLEPLSAPERREALEVASKAIARTLSAELVHSELGKAGKGLRLIKRETGLDPAAISRIATGHYQEGPHLHSVVMIAMALGKVLKISFEDPIIDDD